VNIIQLHILQTAAGIPASGIDCAKYLSTHDDGRCVPLSVLNGGPKGIASRTRRHGFRHKVGMHVDRPGHRFLPIVMHCDNRAEIDIITLQAGWTVFNMYATEEFLGGFPDMAKGEDI